MGELVFLLEEPSAKALLEGLLPRILPEGWRYRFIVFQGKQDLEKGMLRKLRAWKTPGARFVVLRDQDSGDCNVVKDRLVERCVEAKRPETLVRVACRELEAWIVGDLAAFSAEFARPRALKDQDKAKFVDPDLLSNPVADLRTFFPGDQKLDGARRMGRRLDPNSNRSTSFKVFCDGVLRVVG
jgi:Domain of unknown function (DUF4276)